MDQHQNELYQKRSDRNGVPEILSPFNIGTQSHMINKKPLCKMSHQRNYAYVGLSNKEKSYVISSCNTNSKNFARLKRLAAEAVEENKIFLINGTCNAVRKALLDRGWVEKLTINKMNLNKIRNGTYSNQLDITGELERLLLSNFVDKYLPNFIWRTRDDRGDTTIDMKKNHNTIINKLEIDAKWTSKQGLCSSIKRNYWFYIEGVAEVSGPRSYNISEPGEIEDFVNDYKITACTSLLKWVLSMKSNDISIFDPLGTVSIKAIVFALDRCKEYLYRKHNKDIDRELSPISERRWNSFLKTYYCIISNDEIFQAIENNKLSLYLSYAELLLKEMYKYRPQLGCEGCNNIWIIKPGHCSRGIGIRMASKFGVIMDLLSKSNNKHVIQKYIEDPLLIHETKFDIRQYYLVTRTYPLVIWMYKDCYLKFSSQKYNLQNYHESIHLTNNAVQRKYINCNNRHTELPTNNMWDLEKYRKYLSKIGKERVWDNIIYPGMKKSVISIMLSCQDSLSVCKNRFELYGCDFILDQEYKPWLIEINSSPDLHSTTQVTAKLCPAVVTDIIKVIIDHANDPNASTGKFECIYKQPMSIPKHVTAAELIVRGVSLRSDYFYKGNIQIKESDPAVDTKNARSILKRLVQPDIELNVEKSQTLCSLSANEIKRLQEFEIKIEKDSLYIMNSHTQLLSKEPQYNLQNVCGLTNLPSFLEKSEDYLKLKDVKRNINSNWEMDDELNTTRKDKLIFGRGSLNIDCNVFNKKPWNGYINRYIHNENLQETTIKNFIRRDSMVLATSKIISFIDEKEKEYLNLQ
ncbi:unnamed protein product [Leptidea sinapis]|uniref:Tubulin glycylase 3A-like n=1 Tax=Leptidea sinapis TaxID=189913 RepID=A0A5E4QJ48_9NEOP|nr:unnamed protein product [Leptidea sinapis]